MEFAACAHTLNGCTPWEKGEGRSWHFTVADLPEADAIRLAQQGDAAAFERLYNLHSRRVYRLIVHMVSNPAEAEDLTQDVFLQLFRNIHTFRGESSFSTWLHRLSVNIVLMRFRKRRHPEISLDETVDSSEEKPRPSMEVGKLDLRLTGLVDRINLQRAIGQLPDGYKEMFILHDVEGYEHHEIALILGCSTGNSKSQLHKARLRLRELLQEALHEKVMRRKRKATRSSRARRPGRCALECTEA